ncbi:hypothetical protein R3P38DRAFT_3203093 [Favolaschia claudopus]|uniref:CxC2-like cysteine cluster KDZ transposase-associated domain-containing protein n=1 Tax=Favolaschia claudopus TaxID=2862362 RepID=A0AAW0ATG2_9AGAR
MRAVDLYADKALLGFPNVPWPLPTHLLQKPMNSLNISLTQDPLANWVPLRDKEDIAAAAADEETESGEKRKRYESSDEPMKQWRLFIAKFVYELLRLDGLELHMGRLRSVCTMRELHGGETPDISVALSRGSYQCLQEWNGRYWARVSLQDMGLVVQLGHGGWTCPHPAGRARSMVVVDFPYIHTANFKYCACDAADDTNNIEQLLRNQ